MVESHTTLVRAILLIVIPLIYVEGYEIKSFKGGCNAPPKLPDNARMKCSVTNGCVIKCLPGYQTIPIQGSTPCHYMNANQFAIHLKKKRHCLTSPLLLPNNAFASCDTLNCNVTCIENHSFPNGINVFKIVCQSGDWVIPGNHAMSDCKPICDPPWENRCQYNINKCNHEKLEFNGNFECKSMSEKFQCNLTCPYGSKFEFTPSEVYTCSYKTGIFSPNPIPKCIFEDGTHVTDFHIESDYNIPRYVRRASHSESDGWRSPDFCPLKCDVGLEYSVCGSGESVTCQDAAKIKEEEELNPNRSINKCCKLH
ncbi:unnamed protein product [Lepeophtheirus salmonis]|uniref:(salmon louse) hypothetical protein n=1 Tax=Lepeophtheirus salmonis TaxID=72036 RepID=A0A7R8H230_LEPSM|nr:unnamed protein product [Lepeophtheirus salmonis]CAF2806039.1 unnamed protein product [Lepeophtheirus salmonis]